MSAKPKPDEWQPMMKKLTPEEQSIVDLWFMAKAAANRQRYGPPVRTGRVFRVAPEEAIAAGTPPTRPQPVATRPREGDGTGDRGHQ